MIISAQQQANIVTPVSALGRPVVGNESLEAKATALPPVEQTSATDKTLNRPILQAVLAKPDAATAAATSTALAASSATLATSATLVGNGKSLTGSTGTEKVSTDKNSTEKSGPEQKSLADIGSESLSKAIDAADIDTGLADDGQSIADINQQSSDNTEGSQSNQESPYSQQSNQSEPSQSGQSREQKQIAETGFTEEEIKIIQQLAARDREVRAHEQAHSAVGGDIAGSPTYNYKRGPDGVLYAVGGEVSISVSEVPNNPQATLRKAEKVQRAALAPADPSPQDRRVAALAARMAAQARAELAAQTNESNLSSAQGGSSVNDTNNNAIDGSSRSESVFGSRPLNNSDYSNTGYARGYVSERASLQDPDGLNEFYIASLNGEDRQGQQLDFRV